MTAQGRCMTQEEARALLAAVDESDLALDGARAALAAARDRLASLPVTQRAQRESAADDVARARRASDRASADWADASAGPPAGLLDAARISARALADAQALQAEATTRSLSLPARQAAERRAVADGLAEATQACDRARGAWADASAEAVHCLTADRALELVAARDAAGQALKDAMADQAAAQERQVSLGAAQAAERSAVADRLASATAACDTAREAWADACAAAQAHQAPAGEALETARAALAEATGRQVSMPAVQAAERTEVAGLVAAAGQALEGALAAWADAAAAAADVPRDWRVSLPETLPAAQEHRS